MLPRSPLRSPLSLLLLFVTFAAVVVGCASADSTKKVKKKTPYDPGDDFFGEGESTPYEQPISAENDPDSGAFGAASRPSTKDASAADAGSDDGGVVPKTYCTGPLAAGDLAVVEIMISSRAGSSDDGEWVEVQNARNCWLKVKGVSIESPRGAAAPNTVTINEDFELAPKATFIVADSADPAKNHALPGKVFSWDATDVLKNDGDTITVKRGTTVIDRVTFPAFTNLEPGRSLAFPDDCAATARSDWQRWSLTFGAYGGSFKGTPNATNGDVACF
jgi:hypothetical protein